MEKWDAYDANLNKLGFDLIRGNEISDNVFHLSRILVDESYKRHSYGKQIVTYAIDYFENNLEDDIPHIDMVLKLQRNNLVKCRLIRTNNKVIFYFSKFYVKNILGLPKNN